jgi:hypothetical protein
MYNSNADLRIRELPELVGIRCPKRDSNLQQQVRTHVQQQRLFSIFGFESSRYSWGHVALKEICTCNGQQGCMHYSDACFLSETPLAVEAMYS